MKIGTTVIVATVMSLGAMCRVSAQGCEMFQVALEAVGATATTTLLVDQTTTGVPRFAFNAYTTVRRGDTAMAQAAQAPLRAANAKRVPVPPCLTDSLGWHAISDSTLLSFFIPPGTRWTGFRAAFPATPKFAVLSQPVMSGDTATIYVAIASDVLAGRGLILRLVRDATGHWVKQAEAQLWIS